MLVYIIFVVVIYVTLIAVYIELVCLYVQKTLHLLYDRYEHDLQLGIVANTILVMELAIVAIPHMDRYEHGHVDHHTLIITNMIRDS